MIPTRISIITVLLATALLSSCSSRTTRVASSAKGSMATHLVGPVAWHARSERRCLSSGRVADSRFIRARSGIGSPGGCGAVRPYIMKAALGGAVSFQPAATLRCPMIDPVERWLHAVVQPAAERYLGQRVVKLRIAASYACRTRNSRRGARLSEHGRANALDVSAFYLADGSQVTVKSGWRSWGGAGRFLRSVHKGACRHFSTVLGPKADRYHHDHFHFDLARHGRKGTYRVCR